MDKTYTLEQILVIVNTKKCAEKVYYSLKDKYIDQEFLIVHLSTNMCIENRRNVIKNLRNALKEGKKVICVSTQMIEAGVDLSFQCVIRSLAGLDSIIQAAGRCNRHGKLDVGFVYIIKMSRDAENIDSLIDIQKAQSAMKEVLYQFKEQPEMFENDLGSRAAIDLYYKYYLRSRKNELEYPVIVDGVNTTIVQLLSDNKDLWRELPGDIQIKKKNLLLKQAFKSAGELFEVIPEDGKIDVVVEYDTVSKELIEQLNNKYIKTEEKKKVIKKLQKYVVGISEALKQKLGNAIYMVNDVLVLSENYYSRETGVSENPVGMKFLEY